MSVWVTGAICVLVVLTGIFYIIHVRNGGTIVHKRASMVIALALMVFAVNELIVIPIWGVETGTSISSTFFLCFILPLAAYLINSKPN